MHDSSNPERRDSNGRDKRDRAQGRPAGGRDGSSRGTKASADRSTASYRGGARFEDELTDEQKLARQLRPVRTHNDDPDIPEDAQAKELDRIARNELKTLTKENADDVARHLVMVARLIDDDPALAHRHAISASRRAGRIGVVRETLAITAYTTGDYALALRELRTHRRITGSNEQLPLMVDSERGVGRPDKALELGRSIDRTTLTPATQVMLAIAMSGARLDQQNPEAALTELDIPQLNPDVAYPYSPALFRAYAEVLIELGRDNDAQHWHDLALRAEQALNVTDQNGDDETIEIYEEHDNNNDGNGNGNGNDESFPQK